MKKSFYLKYLEDTKKKNKRLDNKKSSFFSFIFKVLKKLFHIIIYILIMVFISLGLTSLVNAQIRQIFIDVLF